MDRLFAADAPESHVHLRALSDILSYQPGRMLGLCIHVSQVGITISDHDRQVGHRAKFLQRRC